MKDHLPPSAPIRTYSFGVDTAEPDERHDEMAAYDDFVEPYVLKSAPGWVVLGLTVLAWAMLIYGVYLAMTLS